MENHNTQNLAEQIALLLQGNERESGNFLRSNVEKINQRLDLIESNIATQNPKSKIRSSKSNCHCSQEKFINLEELATETINGLKDEKACPFEPAGKPCDHCAMCNSRGF